MQPFRIERLEEVTSTNVLVKARISQREPEGYVCRAQRQVGGYGRQGRAWASPVGGLYQSVLLRPAAPMSQWPTLALVVALAVREAVRCTGALADSVVQVKWPNDVVCAQGKLSGISCEAVSGGICVGIGVNVFVPREVQPVGGKYAPAYLEGLVDASVRLSVDVVGDAVLDALAARYDAWCVEGFAPFVQEFQEASVLAGKQVRLEDIHGTGLVEGTVTGIDDQGRLLLQTSDGMRAASAGEVHIL